MLQNLEWKKITAEDFRLENLPATIKIHEYFEASNSHVARTQDRFKHFFGKTPIFLYEKTKKTIAVLPNGGLSLLSLLLKKLPSIWPQEPRKIQKTKIHAKLRGSAQNGPMSHQ